MKKKEKLKLSEEDERRINEVFTLRKELLKLFGDKMGEHNLNVGQTLTLMVAVVYDVANVVARGGELPLGLVLMDFKHGLDIFSVYEEEKKQK